MKVHDIRTILVPIRQVTARSLPAVNKAAQIAEACNAKIELFHDLDNPIVIDRLGGPTDTLRAIKTRALRAGTDALERLAAPLRARGLSVSTAAVWDYPPYEAIVRRALAIGADLIVAPRRDRHRLPALLGYTDWELLRLSPVPVLLVKTSAAYARPRLLAAIDPSHAHAKSSSLDDRILGHAVQISKALRGALHVVHAYTPRPLPSSVTFDTELRDAVATASESEARRTFNRSLAKSSIPAARRHLMRGEPAVAIPAAARKTDSAIVVIGAVSRSGLKRFFIGNTAETIMDSLNCDLLIVKPAKFARKAPRARRGPLFIATGPMM